MRARAVVLVRRRADQAERRSRNRKRPGWARSTTRGLCAGHNMRPNLDRLALVCCAERGAREGMATQVEHQERWGGRRVDVERLHVKCVNDEVVVVYAVPRWRGRAQVLSQASVVAQRE